MLSLRASTVDTVIAELQRRLGLVRALTDALISHVASDTSDFAGCVPVMTTRCKSRVTVALCRAIMVEFRTLGTKEIHWQRHNRGCTSKLGCCAGLWCPGKTHEFAGCLQSTAGRPARHFSIPRCCGH